MAQQEFEVNFGPNNFLEEYGHTGEFGAERKILLQRLYADYYSFCHQRMCNAFFAGENLPSVRSFPLSTGRTSVVVAIGPAGSAVQEITNKMQPMRELTEQIQPAMPDHVCGAFPLVEKTVITETEPVPYERAVRKPDVKIFQAVRRSPSENQAAADYEMAAVGAMPQTGESQLDS